MADLGNVGISAYSVQARHVGAWAPVHNGSTSAQRAAGMTVRVTPGLLQTGGATLEITHASTLWLMREFQVIDRQAPSAGVVTFTDLIDGRYFVHSATHDTAWRVDLWEGVATVTPLTGASYPTVPLGSRLLVIADGKIKAVTPA